MCRSEYSSFLAKLSVCEDQLCVEQGQQQQRQNKADDVVHQIHVQPSVEGAGAERRPCEIADTLR